METSATSTNIIQEPSLPLSGTLSPVRPYVNTDGDGDWRVSPPCRPPLPHLGQGPGRDRDRGPGPLQPYYRPPRLAPATAAATAVTATGTGPASVRTAPARISRDTKPRPLAPTVTSRHQSSVTTASQSPAPVGH